VTKFTLTVATSVDGFISRNTDEPPQAWASAEEQTLFFRDVDAADWSIMGRHTHEAADRPKRRRIIFSTTKSGWQRPTQLWLNPDQVSPQELAHLVGDVWPLTHGLILGGTRVHDWFMGHGAIDRVHLTVEPITFGGGLKMFSDQQGADPITEFGSRGYTVQNDRVLNAQGTRYLEFERSN